MEITTRPITKSATRTRAKDFPFESLQVGQAFFIPAGTVERKKFSVMMNYVGKRLSMIDFEPVKFSWSSGVQDGVDGAFVQRIS